MKRIVAAALAGLVVAATAASAGAQNVSEKVRKINFYTWPQSNLPQAYQASQLIAQQWRQLGLDIDVKPLQRQAQTQLIWYSRDKWDATMWRMVGRPERSDPDEFLYSLFHSSYAEKGYDFIGYSNPEYDKLAEEQRTLLDRDKRRAVVFKMQEIIDHDQPYAFLVHPKYPLAFNKSVFKEDTVVNQSGIGIRNIWTFVNIEPTGAQKDLIINSSEPLNACNPLYIGGAVDSWITDLVWDRLMRIGPDGVPQPWAAESVTQTDDTTVDIKLRAGMSWHDGKPVTVEDAIFSFQAPAGDKAPMYKPFVTEIASMEKTGDLGLRMKLKHPNATFFTATLSKINLIPRHVWEPVLKDLEGKPETAEQLKDVNRIGSGPFKMARWKPNEEVVLERFGEHFKAPKVERWIMRIVPNAEATLGMLKRGETQLPGLLRRRPRGAGEVRQGQSRDRHQERGRRRLRVRGLQQPPRPVQRQRLPPRLVDLDRSPADGLGRLAGFRRPGQQPRLAGTELLARSRRRHDEDGPRRGEEDPAAGRLPADRRQALLSAGQQEKLTTE